MISESFNQVLKEGTCFFPRELLVQKSFGFIKNSTNNIIKIFERAGLNKYVDTSYFAVDTVEDVQFDIKSTDYDNARMDFEKLKKQYPELQLSFEINKTLNKEGLKLLKAFQQSDITQGIYTFINEK